MQVNLSDPILSRFDILCIVKDEKDSNDDERLAKFVVNSHIKHHPNFSDNSETLDLQTPASELPIPQDLLKKYIVYAKQNIHPKLSNIDNSKIAKKYNQLRQESLVCLFLILPFILLFKFPF